MAMASPFDLPPFHNEPFTDFSRPDNVAAFRAALSRVRGQLGRRHPNAAGARRFELDATLVSTNPARPSEVIGTFPASGAAQADEALAAADAAFPAWSARPWEERAAILLRVADRLRRDKHEFSAWMVLEAGKTWAEADGDTAEAIDFCAWYAREALRYARGVDVVQTADRNECFYVPLGCGVAIAPWNFPLAILCGMTVSALVTGNTVVMKPAEETPTIGWRLYETLLECGVPAGAVSFLTGPGETVGARLVESPLTRFVSFTGSKAVGLWITRAAAVVHPGQRFIKRVVTELGGKDAIVVDASADLEAAAAGVVAAAYGFSGQKCSACSRAIVHTDVYDRFVPMVVERARALRVGDPSEPTTQVGPVISQEAQQRILGYVERGPSEGRVVLGGGPSTGEGWFVQPTIVADVGPDARLAQEEVFGPVLAILRARDWSHAIDIANGTDYGLTGAAYSRDEEHLEDARRRFHVGNLYLNRKCTGALVGAQPFGGFGLSGTCSKAGGRDYLGLFLQQKSVARSLST
jgi:1-pyrroline-5-carboxylate dehydrogenase